MQIVVTGRHLDITDAIRAHAAERGDRLTRYYDRVSAVEVVIAKDEPNRFQVEMIASVDRHDPFVAHGHHQDLYAGIDEVAQKLERQLTDHKEKLRNRKHPARR